MANIKIMALGGLGEQGKNMYIVEVNESIFIFDAGLKYPEINMFGVDAIVPDITYLIENKERIEGVFVSHGHQDNIGALAYLLRNIPLRVYGTHFTISLIEESLANDKMDIKKYKLFRINENKTLKFKNATCSFFNTTHSIPESVGIALKTEDGVIVYATDFNFNPQTENYYQVSYDKITELGKENVLAVLAESVGTTSLGRPKNTSAFEYSFNSVLNKVEKRLLVAVYSSDLLRMQQVINLCLAKGKKIAFIGKNADRLVNLARTSNYINIPESSLLSLKYLDENNKNDIKDLVVIVTGVRNEPYNTLMRMARGDDRLINVEKGDSIVIMCPAMAGSELYVTNAINELYRSDASLTIYKRSQLCRTHADEADLRTLYAMLKPKYIIPIKGEYRHMYEHSLIAMKYGKTRDEIALLDNGEMIEINNGILGNRHQYHLNDVFVDGSLIGGVNEEVIKDRETLSEEGIVIINVGYDVRTRKIVLNPNVITKGFTYKMNKEELDKIVIELTTRVVNNALQRKSFDLLQLKDVVENEVSNTLFRFTRHRPVIVSNIIEVNKPHQEVPKNKKHKITKK